MRKHYGFSAGLFYRAVTAISASIRTIIWTLKALAGENSRVYREKAYLQRKLLVWAVTGVRR
jgi:hypothetical protein